jgi:16S rRNA (uracil1498-N3)-methyltransferase
MNLFYTKEIEGQVACFTGDEFRHAILVLRKKTGDLVEFVDGKGFRFLGQIISVSKTSFEVEISSSQQEAPIRQGNLHIAIAPTKNIERFEWFLEKATEIGIDEITPVFCFNSERFTLRADRLEKILLAAMKQSLKASLPKLNPSVKFNEFIKSIPLAVQSHELFIAHCRSLNLPHLKNNYLRGNDVCILIGPEGDFSREEVEMVEKMGGIGISLGTSRLRTETAGIVACHIVNLLNE